MDISIITTVKNNPLGIYSTIKSVINQRNFKNIEYVIVDASTDKHTSLVINNLSIKECLEKGTGMSSKIIQKVGARLD